MNMKRTEQTGGQNIRISLWSQIDACITPMVPQLLVSSQYKIQGCSGHMEGAFLQHPLLVSQAHQRQHSLGEDCPAVHAGAFVRWMESFDSIKGAVGRSWTFVCIHVQIMCIEAGEVHATKMMSVNFFRAS